MKWIILVACLLLVPAQLIAQIAQITVPVDGSPFEVFGRATITTGVKKTLDQRQEVVLSCAPDEHTFPKWSAHSVLEIPSVQTLRFTHSVTLFVDDPPLNGTLLCSLRDDDSMPRHRAEDVELRVR